MKKEIKWIKVGYKIYCPIHKYNRDITCKECNEAFAFNCRADAKELLMQQILKME